MIQLDSLIHGRLRTITVLEPSAGTPHPTLIFGERGERETAKPQFEHFTIAHFEAWIYYSKFSLRCQGGECVYHSDTCGAFLGDDDQVSRTSIPDRLMPFKASHQAHPFLIRKAAASDEAAALWRVCIARASLRKSQCF